MATAKIVGHICLEICLQSLEALEVSRDIAVHTGALHCTTQDTLDAKRLHKRANKSHTNRGN